jgi:membrane-associated phospholipid phosphatase
LEAAGAAFPSSHVAVSLCTCLFSWRYLRRIRWVHALMVTLLCLATVYCRYHYAVDVIAGVVAGLILVPLGDWLHRRTEPHPTAANAPTEPGHPLRP